MAWFNIVLRIHGNTSQGGIVHSKSPAYLSWFSWFNIVLRIHGDTSQGGIVHYKSPASIYFIQTFMEIIEH